MSEDAPKPAALRPGLVDGALLALTIAAVVLLTRDYVSSERFFYYWDYAVYQDIAETTAEAFRTLSSLDSFYTVYRSTNDAYSSLFAVPLVPILLTFGESRVVYTTGLAVLYFVPFILALGAVAVRLVRGHERAIFWSTVAIALLTPMAWVPTLRGFPDAAAATLLALAVRLYLDDLAEGRRMGHALFAGALAGLAILLRRHFVFGVAALFVSLTLHAGLAAARDAWSKRPGGGARRLRSDLTWIAAAAVGCALMLVLVGHYFLLRILTLEYASYYRAYEMPVRETLAWFAKPYSLPLCLLSALGFLTALRARILEPAAAGFVLLFGLLSFLQWVCVARQIGEQYTLHFTPTLVLGLTCLLWTIWRGVGVRRQPFTAALAALLCVNLFFGLAGVPAAYEPWPLRSAIFAANWPPLKGDSYEGVRSLVDYLHGRASAQTPVFVAASSHEINPSLLAHAEWALYGRAHARLDVLDAPAIDTRDSYPLEMLLRADWVVVVQPFQHHLDPADQQVVSVVLDLFETGQGLAADFAPESERFPLVEDATAVVYRRQRLTTLDTAVASLSFIESHVTHPPGTRPDWFALSHRTPPLIREQGADSWTLLTSPKERDDDPGNAWIYLPPLPPTVRATGRTLFVEKRCPGITLAFWGIGPEDHRERLAVVPRKPGDDSTFDLRLPARGARRIVVEVADSRPGDTKTCLAWIVDLRIGDGV